MPGDLDGDADVDSDDYELFKASYGKFIFSPSCSTAADYDDDGIVTLVDYQIWLQHYRNAHGLDLNRDGSADAADAAALAACLGGPREPLGPECLSGDLNGDEAVDLADFAAFQVLFPVGP